MSAAPLRWQRLPGAAAPDPLPLPAYATATAAGLDLAAALRAPVALAPGERTLIPTGFALELPSGHEGQVRPRSGWALRSGVTVLNAPGTIDPDFRGELQVLLINLGSEPVVIQRGDRIAQLVVAPFTRVFGTAAEGLPATARGSGGFGHTGLHRSGET